jgi:S1-C subfamily serine protease
MIRKSINRTIESTFIVRIPDPENKDFPTPTGTGFFISSDGYFITAYHVVANVTDFSKVWITKPEFMPPIIAQSVNLIQSFPKCDIAILKASNLQKPVQFLEIDLNDHIEGTPIYAFGYPLPEIKLIQSQNMMIGFDFICPRVTSSIISSKYDMIGPIRTSQDTKYYVIDKALNYGNSGGPIILVESGKVISVCVRFQPVNIPQLQGASVTIPSLYGISSSLINIKDYLDKIYYQNNATTTRDKA